MYIFMHFKSSFVEAYILRISVAVGKDHAGSRHYPIPA